METSFWRTLNFEVGSIPLACIFSGYSVCLYNEGFVYSQLYFSCSFTDISSPKYAPFLHFYFRK